MRHGLITLLSILSIALTAQGQDAPDGRPRARPASDLTGWADWERAKTIFEKIQVPPSPPLSPEEALKTFRVAPGFRLELVASEPMIASPIFFEFDPEGRIWAIEYRGYMRNLKGEGEGEPICRIVVLEDFNGDGKVDRSTVFLDKLVMPRSLTFVKGGLLVAEPPHLWFCQDTNADLKCDLKTEVGTYGRPGNPQHTANGLAYGIDNWLHSADWQSRHRFAESNLVEEPTLYRGQFGVTFDELGRFTTCRENAAAHMDLIPEPYFRRNPALMKSVQKGRDRGGYGLAVDVADAANECFPIRPTPGVTLGGLELRDDGTLRTYTIVSGTGVYLGDQFPPDAYGNLFVPEAGGNLIGRLRLDPGMDRKAERYYPANQEILASTDERFRPMNIRTGPDGTLYFADMYQGIIEHVIFMAPYLTEQIQARGLDRGTDMGRIYRLVSTNQPVRTSRPQLTSATSARLVRHLGHSNGWWRMTAQRLLVERQDESVLPRLKQVAMASTNPIARMHALWTLDGLGKLDWTNVVNAIATPASRSPEQAMVKATALRLSEAFLTKPLTEEEGGGFIHLLEQASADSNALVRLYVLLTTSALPSTQAEKLTAKLLTENESPLFRTAVLSGLAHRETDFLRNLFNEPAWREPNQHRRAFLREAMFVVFDSQSAASMASALELMVTQEAAVAWRREVLLEGLIAAAPKESSQFEPIILPAEPRILAQLLKSSDKQRRDQAWKLTELFTWPGADQTRRDRGELASFSPAEAALFSNGRELFHGLCAPCHQPHGGGLANVAPPLNRSTWVSGPPDRLIRVLLHGLYGPLEVGNQRWNHHMPGFGDTVLALDEPVAAVLTYVRRSWDNRSPPVSVSEVAQTRVATRDRKMPWTSSELLAVPDRSPSVAKKTQPSVEPITPDPTGTLTLPASRAVCFGEQLSYRASLDILAPWRKENDVATWEVRLPEGGRFEVFVKMAADEASAGDRFAIEMANQRLVGTVVATGDYAQFKEVKVGTLLMSSGVQKILMRPEGKLRGELADIRSVQLVPAR